MRHRPTIVVDAEEITQWRMAPVYDLTPSEGINGEQTCMVNNKGLNIAEKDLQAAAATVDVDGRTVREITQQVDEALSRIRVNVN